jgi:hypothetical protein
MSTRIYYIRDRENGQAHLVRAKTPAAALAAVVKPQFSVELADQESLVRCVAAGVAVRDADEVVPAPVLTGDHATIPAPPPSVAWIGNAPQAA